MDKLKLYLKYSQTLSVLGIVLILTSFFDIAGIPLLFIPLKLTLGVFLLGAYHIVSAVVQLVEPEE